MDREQHVVQDAAELYAVFVMQDHAEKLGIALHRVASDRWIEFENYLDAARLTLGDFDTGLFAQYKANADAQLPAFVDRLAVFLGDASLEFENVERDFRNQGLKADFLVHTSNRETPIAVSLKNYIGSGGISRPQVSSGTFASFAAGFVFDRVGVGKYTDPRRDGATFLGRDIARGCPGFA